MEYRRLGKKGPRVSAVGLGTGQFGAKGWGYGTLYGDLQIANVIDAAIGAGTTLIDTSETYGSGRSEVLIGEALRRHNRDDVVVVTKVAPWNLSYDRVIRAAEKSLARLQVGEIDLYLVHYSNPFISMKETFRAMERLVTMGKVRQIGVSNFGRFLIGRAMKSLPRSEIVVNEIEYNLLSRRAENFTIPFCLKNGIGIIGFSPLAGGILTGSFSAESRAPGRARAFNFTNSRSSLKGAVPLFLFLEELARKKGVSVAQVALGFVLSRGFVVPIPAALRPSEVLHNSDAASLRLSMSEIGQIEDLTVAVGSPTFLFDNYAIRPISWLKESLRHVSSP